MQIKEIIQYLESVAPLEYQENYDNAGLIIGDKNRQLTNALLTLDITEAVLEEAMQKNCNLIIAHHPVIFHGVKKITGNNFVERIIIRAIKNDIAIYAAHTNLDNIKTGVSNTMADKLGLINCEVLSPLKNNLKKLYTFVPQDHAEKIREVLFAAGAGHIGQYSECSYNTEGAGTFKPLHGTDPFVGKIGEQHAELETKIEMIFAAHLQSQIIWALLQHHPYEEPAYDIISLDNENNNVGAGIIGELSKPMDAMNFLKYLKQQMNAGCIRHTAITSENISRVALCGGAGSFLLSQAITSGAQIFITADFKYHDFFNADNKIIIADIGHYESEQYAIELFYKLLTKKFPNFAPLKSSINTNPVNYLT